MMREASLCRAFCYASDAIAGFFTVLLKGKCYTVQRCQPCWRTLRYGVGRIDVGLYKMDESGTPASIRQSQLEGTSTFNRLIPHVSQLSCCRLVCAGLKPLRIPPHDRGTYTMTLSIQSLGRPVCRQQL